MPGSFVAAIVFAIIAALILVVRRFLGPGKPPPAADPSEVDYATREYAKRVEASRLVRKVLLIAGGTSAAIAFLFLIAAMYNPVGTRKEGIELTFGRPSGQPLQNGFHLTAPWVKVATMDAAIQTDVYARDSDVKRGANASGDCIAVRMAFQQLGCVDISLRWRIQPNSGNELYRDYRSFDHVRGSLVTRELRAAVNEQFAAYNPLNSVAGLVKGEHNPTLGEEARRVAGDLRGTIGTRINVLGVIISLIHYDGETQKRIDQLQQQVAETRIAAQQLITNTNLAEANAALSKSVNTSPNVLVAQCMNTLQAMVKNGQTVPAGFSCWPGGSGVSVIAGGK